MAEESDLERNEAPTPRRLEQAREEGQVARSPELATFAVLMAGVGGLWFTGGHLFSGLEKLMVRGLHIDAVADDPGLMQAALLQHATDALFLLVPLFAVMFVVALAAPLGLSGWLFTFKPVEPDFSRLNPLQGITRMVSGQALAELGKALAKAAVIGIVATVVLSNQTTEMVTLLTLPLEQGIAETGRILVWSLAAVAGGMILIVAADVPLQLWRHTSRLRMSREDIKKEMKETEGDPQVKAIIRSQQREMARRRMMAAVPGADVVVTNPAHNATA